MWILPLGGTFPGLESHLPSQGIEITDFLLPFPPEAWGQLESRSHVLWSVLYRMGHLASSRCSKTIYYPNTQMNVLKIGRVGSISSANFFACYLLKTRKTPHLAHKHVQARKALWGRKNEGGLPLKRTSVSRLWIDTLHRFYYWCCCYYFRNPGFYLKGSTCNFLW